MTFSAPGRNGRGPLLVKPCSRDAGPASALERPTPLRKPREPQSPYAQFLLGVGILPRPVRKRAETGTGAHALATPDHPRKQIMRPGAGAMPLGPNLSTRPRARAPCNWEPACVSACAQRDCIQRTTPRAFTTPEPVGKDVRTQLSSPPSFVRLKRGREGARPLPIQKTTNAGHLHAAQSDSAAP